jgi:hypothetical protein
VTFQIIQKKWEIIFIVLRSVTRNVLKGDIQMERNLIKELEELHDKYMHELEIEKRYDLNTLVKMGEIAERILKEAE